MSDEVDASAAEVEGGSADEDVWESVGVEVAGGDGSAGEVAVVLADEDQAGVTFGVADVVKSKGVGVRVQEFMAAVEEVDDAGARGVGDVGSARAGSGDEEVVDAVVVVVAGGGEREARASVGGVAVGDDSGDLRAADAGEREDGAHSSAGDDCGAPFARFAEVSCANGVVGASVGVDVADGSDVAAGLFEEDSVDASGDDAFWGGGERLQIDGGDVSEVVGERDVSFSEGGGAGESEGSSGMWLFATVGEWCADEYVGEVVGVDGGGECGASAGVCVRGVADDSCVEVGSGDGGGPVVRAGVEVDRAGLELGVMGFEWIGEEEVSEAVEVDILGDVDVGTEVSGAFVGVDEDAAVGSDGGDLVASDVAVGDAEDAAVVGL